MSSVYDDLDAKYAAICSEATLQSNSKGFFKPFVESVEEMATATGFLDVLAEKRGDRAKLAALVENEELMGAIGATLAHAQPMRREKGAETSRARRRDAEQALHAADLRRALALASQAVIRAPPTGEKENVDGGLSLAFALWLRSEVLLAMGEHHLALNDLKLALKERLPAKQRGDYYWRMGNCYRGTGELARAKVSYDLAMRLVGGSTDAKARLEADIQQLEAISAAEMSTDTIKKEDIMLTSGAKQNMPSLSKLVKITEESNKGRYAVANVAIKTGDVLLVESPYAACLLPEYYGSHCCHCFQRLIAPMWCPLCSGVAFCSPDCRDAALATYHPHECSFSDLFIGSGMSILSHIALRMVTQAGLDISLSIHSKYVSNDSTTVEVSALNDIEGTVKTSKLKSRKEKLSRGKKKPKNINSEKKSEESNVSNGEQKKEENLELKAAQIYSLCTHSDLRNPKDFLQRIIMALFLVDCLKKSSFFGKKENIDMEKERAICELLLRNLQLLQFNAHELYETLRTAQHKFSGAKANYIAVAVYPTAALFNHECYPAVARYFDGTKIVLRAIRPLRPGETIAENYGPQFLVRSRTERQRALACRYWFKCECRACTQDWPTLKQMTNGSEPFVKCSNNQCSRGVRGRSSGGGQRTWPRACPHCGSSLSQQDMSEKWDIINKCIDDYQEAAKLMEAEAVEDAKESLCSAMNAFHEACAPPHRETHLAQEALRACFADSGNVHVVQLAT